MFTLPIFAFFAVHHWLTTTSARVTAASSDHNTFAQYMAQNPDFFAGGAAILVTNCIVGLYCYSAYVEDQKDQSQNSKRTNHYKDEQPPRVGIFKTRTD